jgi:hypothetical protein
VVGTQVGAYPVEVSPSPSSPEDASRVVACHPLIKAVEHRAAFAPEVLLVLLVLQVLQVLLVHLVHLVLLVHLVVLEIVEAEEPQVQLGHVVTQVLLEHKVHLVPKVLEVEMVLMETRVILVLVVHLVPLDLMATAQPVPHLLIPRNILRHVDKVTSSMMPPEESVMALGRILAQHAKILNSTTTSMPRMDSTTSIPTWAVH